MSVQTFSFFFLLRLARMLAHDRLTSPVPFRPVPCVRACVRVVCPVPVLNVSTSTLRCRLARAPPPTPPHNAHAHTCTTYPPILIDPRSLCARFVHSGVRRSGRRCGPWTACGTMDPNRCPLGTATKAHKGAKYVNSSKNAHANHTKHTAPN